MWLGPVARHRNLHVLVERNQIEDQGPQEWNDWTDTVDSSPESVRSPDDMDVSQIRRDKFGVHVERTRRLANSECRARGQIGHFVAVCNTKKARKILTPDSRRANVDEQVTFVLCAGLP